MKVQRFAISGEDPPRLELRWEGLQAAVYLDGVHVTTLDGARGLKQGWSAQLEDGAQVEIRSVRRVLFPELSVLRNGKHVQSSPSHPDKMLRSSSNTMIILSVFLLGAAVMSGGQGYAWLDVLFSLLYFIGALLLRRGRRLGAAVIALPLFIRLDILLLALFVQPVDRMWLIELALSLLFATFVIRSYQAARDSRTQRMMKAEAPAG
jgi:hypothetical protein